MNCYFKGFRVERVLSSGFMFPIISVYEILMLFSLDIYFWSVLDIYDRFVLCFDIVPLELISIFIPSSYPPLFLSSDIIFFPRRSTSAVELKKLPGIFELYHQSTLRKHLNLFSFIKSLFVY